MLNVIINTIIESLNILPFLFVIYIGIELIEFKWGHSIKNWIQKAGNAGPLVGAIGGSLPQCGFSVIATALYTQKFTTLGTLMAVYLSTSDEAIPIILSRPEKIGVILPLIITKVFIAIIAGYSIDLFLSKQNKSIKNHAAHCEETNSHDHSEIIDEAACCGHKPNSDSTKFDSKEVILHPIIHTAKIFLYIIVISLIINSIIFFIGEQNFTSILKSNTIFQPFFAALLGLMPNCASSVAITELYLNSSITYGATIAGLSASGGLGLIVLFKESTNKKNAIKIVGLLFAISVVAGYIIQILNISF